MKTSKASQPETATLLAVVAKISARRSVEIRLIGMDGWQVAGHVTIPPQHRIPGIGRVIGIRYRYAFPDSELVHQPEYVGERADVEHHECVRSQLKFKASNEEADDV